MGDFSVPCVLSGLPIAARSPVVGFKIRKARYEDADQPYGPVSLPFTGVINNYGDVDGRDDREETGSLTVFAHASLFVHQGRIFAEAMPKAGSLYEEMVTRKRDHREMWAEFASLDRVTEANEDICRRHTVCARSSRGNQEPWVALMHHLLICVSDPATFKTDLAEWLFARVLSEDFETSAEAVRTDINNLQHLLCVFAATRITGHPIRPPGYCFEQYPTFKWETAWHTEVAAVCRRCNLEATDGNVYGDEK